MKQCLLKVFQCLHSEFPNSLNLLPFQYAAEPPIKCDFKEISSCSLGSTGIFSRIFVLPEKRGKYLVRSSWPRVKHGRWCDKSLPLAIFPASSILRIFLPVWQIHLSMLRGSRSSSLSRDGPAKSPNCVCGCGCCGGWGDWGAP